MNAKFNMVVIFHKFVLRMIRLNFDFLKELSHPTHIGIEGERDNCLFALNDSKDLLETSNENEEQDKDKGTIFLS